MSSLGSRKKGSGRPPIINSDVREQLLEELKEPQGFKSYEEIRTWLKAVEGIEASYKVVHETVRYQMKAKLKVPRAVGIKHTTEAESEFKKNCHNT
ncbi:helix-turn-helix domain-containing protein [Nostoc sp. MG11]|uniref:helix-turn-helix domain-containing protein n=1 Tax=Nostoc sp. MG11 TaxID=2721166 RepID=UPI001867A743|nr:helix-turn-helix domain-containing protein [Nostoc sp. MG11]